MPIRKYFKAKIAKTMHSDEVIVPEFEQVLIKDSATGEEYVEERPVVETGVEVEDNPQNSG